MVLSESWWYNIAETDSERRLSMEILQSCSKGLHLAHQRNGATVLLSSYATTRQTQAFPSCWSGNGMTVRKTCGSLQDDHCLWAIGACKRRHLTLRHFLITEAISAATLKKSLLPHKRSRKVYAAIKMHAFKQSAAIQQSVNITSTCTATRGKRT